MHECYKRVKKGRWPADHDSVEKVGGVQPPVPSQAVVGVPFMLRDGMICHRPLTITKSSAMNVEVPALSKVQPFLLRAAELV